MKVDGDRFVELLGYTADDDIVRAFLADCGIQKRPKIPRDEEDVNISNKELGLEVTFTDEEALDVQTRDYVEGSVVLSSIRMYGNGSKTFRKFEGELPAGLNFNMTPDEVYAKLDKKPAWQNPKRTSARWDYKDHCLFLNTDPDRKRIVAVSVQLPVG